MKNIKEKIDFLIKENLNNLLDSQAQSKGVYIAHIDMGADETSLEVELDEGNIAFSLMVKNNECPDCGKNEFSANQVCRVNVVVDNLNNFIRNQDNNMESSVYDADNPFGPYSCMDCGFSFDEIDELEKNISNTYDLLHDSLKNAGIGVYTNYSDFEEAINDSE